MEQEIRKMNLAVVEGEIISDFQYSHSAYGKRFYKTEVVVKRLSDAIDIIPIMVQENLIDINQYQAGQHVCAKGMFHSYRYYKEDGNHMVWVLLALEMSKQNQDMGGEENNNILLEGYICKSPCYRKVASGRKITDILIAVNYPSRKSDYLPCICWGKNAVFAADLKTGEHIKINGRIQSRDYIKKISEKKLKLNTVYEISVREISVLT